MGSGVSIGSSGPGTLWFLLRGPLSCWKTVSALATGGCLHPTGTAPRDPVSDPPLPICPGPLCSYEKLAWSPVITVFPNSFIESTTP